MSTNKRVRSPNYPAISLPEAIPKITAIYEREFTHPADSNTLAIAIGYSGNNGASDAVLSALKKYGLLELTGKGEYKLSSNAIDIILHERGADERKKAVLEAAFTPPLFAELHDEFGINPPPSENNLRIRLLKKEFNPKTVGDAIRSYLDTIEFVSREAPDYNKGQSGKNDNAGERTTNMENAALHNQNKGNTQSPPPPENQERAAHKFSYQLSFPRNIRAEVSIFGKELRKQDIELLKKEVGDLAKAFDEETGHIKRTAVWHNKDFDIPVVVVSEPEKADDGKEYVAIEGSKSRIPYDEVEFTD